MEEGFSVGHRGFEVGLFEGGWDGGALGVFFVGGDVCHVNWGAVVRWAGHGFQRSYLRR